MCMLAMIVCNVFDEELIFKLICHLRQKCNDEMQRYILIYTYIHLNLYQLYAAKRNDLYYHLCLKKDEKLT